MSKKSRGHKRAASLLGYTLNREEARFVDRAMMVVSVLQPITAIPQAVNIYSNKSAADVSLVTWVGFTLVGIIFSCYALAHRIKPMIVNQVIWFAVDAAIVVGILLYS